MSDELRKSDYLDMIDNLKIQIKEHKLNIKDARNALRHAVSGEDRLYYRQLIRRNREELKEAKATIKVIKMRVKGSFWFWLLIAILCCLIFVFIPGASLALILSPIWIVVIIGFLYILYLVRK